MKASRTTRACIFGLVLAAHATLVVSLLAITRHAGSEPRHRHATQVASHVKILDDAPLRVLDRDGDKHPKPGDIGNNALKSDCDGRVYIGLGIKSDFAGLVLEVAPNSPAADAGLLVNDVLLNRDDTWPDAHPIGYPLRLHVQRGDKVFYTTAIVGRICDEVPKPGRTP